MKAFHINKTGQTITVSTSSLSMGIPRDSTGYLPKYVAIRATAPVYVKCGYQSATAVAGDMMVQPSDGVNLCVSGCNVISVVALTGSAIVTVTPLEEGAWTYDTTPAYGLEQVATGDFSSSTGWSVPAGWTIGGGNATAAATSATLRYGTTTTVGQAYKVEFDISTYTSGTLYVAIGDSYGTAVSYTSSGHKTVNLTVVSSGTPGVAFYGGSFAGVLDNVSVMQVL